MVTDRLSQTRPGHILTFTWPLAIRLLWTDVDQKPEQGLRRCASAFDGTRPTVNQGQLWVLEGKDSEEDRKKTIAVLKRLFPP